MKKLLLILLCVPLIGLGQQTYVPDDNYTVEFKTDSTFLIQFNHKGETKSQLITHKFDEMYYPEDKEGYLMRRLTYDDWSFDGILDLSISCMHRSGSGGTVYDIWIFNKDIGQFEYEDYLSSTFIEKDDESKTVRQYYRMGVDGRGEEISWIDTFYSGNKIYNSTFERFKKDFIDKQLNENKSTEWNTLDGKKIKEEFLKECLLEAQSDMGDKYYEYETEIKGYCDCMMDLLSKVYPTPDESSLAFENSEKEFYATIIQYGGLECLDILMNGIERKTK